MSYHYLVQSAIFGYNKITITLISLLWGIELPSDSITKEGNIYEGDYFIPLRKRFQDQHPDLEITVDLGDGHYDNKPSYKWCRKAVPELASWELSRCRKDIMP